MTRFALPQASMALLAMIQMALSKAPGRRDTGWPAALCGEVHDSSWANFSEATKRWSSYEAPTFNSVFLPKTERDLSLGVSVLFLSLQVYSTSAQMKLIAHNL